MMAGGTDLLIGVTVEAVLAAIALGVVYRLWGGALGLPKLNKIQPFQRGVLMKGEVVDRVLEPGTHWISPKKTIFLCDTRPKPFQLNSQDIQAASDTWIRVSMRGATRIVDPARYVTASSDSLATLYTELRRLLTEAAQEQIFGGRVDDSMRLATRMRELLEREAEGLGLTVASLDIWEVLQLYPRRVEERETPSLPVQ
jgi:regulator of protease activity HflC (stomatin/prohibitin superfamily)